MVCSVAHTNLAQCLQQCQVSLRTRTVTERLHRCTKSTLITFLSTERLRQQHSQQEASHCYCPCWTAVYSERCLRRMLSEVSKWQSPRTYRFLPFPSLEGWQILQNLRCSLPLSEPGLLTQCPVQEKDNVKESSNQWHTDTSSATICTTRRGLLSAFMISSQPILCFSRRWGKRLQNLEDTRKKDYAFSV